MKVFKEKIFEGSKEYYQSLDKIGITFHLQEDGIYVKKEGVTGSEKFISRDLRGLGASKVEFFPNLGIKVQIYYNRYTPEPTLNAQDDFSSLVRKLINYLSDL